MQEPATLRARFDPTHFQRVTTTRVPTVTRVKRSPMSSLYIRMQPYEANLPIDSGRLVPCMAYSPPERVRAATPIGLLGAPPGITSGRLGLSSRTIPIDRACGRDRSAKEATRRDDGRRASVHTPACGSSIKLSILK